MAQRGGVQATVMGLSWRWPDVGKNGRSQNSFTAATTGRGGHLKKRGASSELLWPGHVPGLNPGCCASELNKLGECDGGHCFLCCHGNSPPLCWSFGVLVGADEDLPETFDIEADFLHAGLD